MRLKTYISDADAREKRSPFQTFTGSASPEGAVTANVGDYYLKTGSPGALYVKKTGTGNTGWVTYAESSATQVNFTVANNQSSPANVTGVVYDKAAIYQVVFAYRLRRKTDSSTRLDHGTLYMSYNDIADTWEVKKDFQSVDSMVEFTATTAGQLQYTSDNMAGANYNGSLRIVEMQTLAI